MVNETLHRKLTIVHLDHVNVTRQDGWDNRLARMSYYINNVCIIIIMASAMF
jgi:hypothetical protein